MNVTQLEEMVRGDGINHVNFFNGRLLSGEDLSAEQEATHAHARQLGQALGAGVAMGLEVLTVHNVSPADVQVKIAAGLAVNRAGAVLRLACDQIISLVRPSDAEVRADCVFFDCSPLSGGTSLSGEGFFVLTIAPASQREGLAPVSGLGNSAAPCNSRFLTEGVQFRLLPLNLAAISDVQRVRNEAAYQCFGLPARTSRQFISDALLEKEPAGYGLEKLVTGGRLTEQDVPLAILQWSANAGLGFLDRWSVRRRIARPAAAKSWGYFTDYRRRAESEAIFQQFQEEISEIQLEAGIPSGLAAEKRFKYLPPGGLLPVGGNNFDWKLFLGAHAPAAEVALDSDQARALLWRALGEDPVLVVPISKATTANPPPMRFQVYRITGQTDLVLFLRPTRNEVLAEDVYYDNSVCRLEGVETVQEALDALCSAQNGCCTLVATPEAGWEKMFARIPAGGSASVCFPIGDYPLSGPVTIEGKGHLRLTGCGFGSRITADKSEAALIFKGCAGVTVSHLAAQTGVSGAKESALENLNGVFTFLNCGSVTVEGSRFRCAADAQTGATCLTVRNAAPSTGAAAATGARVVACELLVGAGQIGALFINVARIQVQDNVVRADGKPVPLRLAGGSRQVRGMKRLLFSGAVAGARRASARVVAGNATVTYAGQVIQFQTDARLVGSSPADNAWQKAIDKLQPTGINDPQKLREFTEDLADKLLVGQGRVAGLDLSNFLNVVKEVTKQTQAVASGGIWIAGTSAPEVRVLNNTVEGVLAGIHVGLRRGTRIPRERPDLAGAVHISGNRIQVQLPSFAEAERHGIFIGNVASLLVENNFIVCEREPNAAGINLEGIRIYGFIGGTPISGRMIVRANHLRGFPSIGILFNPLNAPPPENRNGPSKPWVIAENLAENAKIPVQVPQAFQAAVRLVDNYS
jgi:hypothetical protein